MGNIDLEGKITLDEVLLKAKANTKKFIEQLEKEESGERIETTDAIKNKMMADIANTRRKKSQFIEEIKSDLGKEIKEKKGRGVIIKKPTLGDRIKKFFTKLYSKF